jgi:Putative auto-transporter adhesin, head GIN domain
MIFRTASISSSVRRLSRVPTISSSLALTALTALTTLFMLTMLPAAHAENWSISISTKGNKQLVGSGNVISQTRTVEPFNAISVKSAADVVIRQTGKSGVEVRADDNIVPLITTEVNGGTLIVSMKEKSWIRSKNKIVVTVDVADLTAVAISGSGDVSATSLNTNSLKFSVSGSGDIRLGDLITKSLDLQVSGSGDTAIDRLNANDLTVSIDGSGDFRAEGSAATQRFSIGGSGDVRASKLQGKDVRVSIAGSGDVAVWATGTLNATVAGSGDVRYTGDAVVTKSVAGSGSVSKR